MNSETRQCQSCKRQFTVEPEDLAMLGRLDLSAPKECPSCIWKKLLAFFTFGRFRKAKSALSGKTIITTFSEQVRFPLYDRTEWVSDDWDPMKYGQEYNPNCSFLEQFAKLQAQVPHPHQSGIKNTNCDWSDDVWQSKNCYLCRSLLNCEDLSYGYRTVNCKNSVDLTYCFDTELSYDCLYCFKCYKVRHSFDARDSLESAFLYDCRNVQNCFMCWNLRNKQYHILNQPYSREEYFSKLKEYDLRSRASVEELKKEFAGIIAKEAIHRADHNTNAVNSSGNFLFECKNCVNSYFVDTSENCRHIFRGVQVKDSIYCVASLIEKGAFSSVDAFSYETAVTSHSASCRYSAYLDYCEECEYCFGCVGLRKKNYCILNKQYSEAEYKEIVQKIKSEMKKTGEWGEFFPYNMAYCGYNLSLAQLYFPESKEGVQKFGGLWDDFPADTEGISSEEIPGRIDETKDEISSQAFICSKTGWRFNLAPREIAFYRQLGIPPPKYHPDWRTIERFKPLTAIEPQSGRCHFCGKGITHFYPPEWGYQKIACVECYKREVA